MKPIIVSITFCLLIILSACKKERQVKETTCVQMENIESSRINCDGSICTTDLCMEYQTIWKELFLEKNNLSEGYFNEHVFVCSTDTSTWQQGVSFNVCYEVGIGWAKAWNCDQFIVKIQKGNNLYPAVNLPRDVFLSKVDIHLAIINRVFASDIVTLSNDETLKFESIESAIEKLKNESPVSNLCVSSIFINETTGHMILESYATYTREKNLCISGSLDLITGSTTFEDMPCLIN